MARITARRVTDAVSELVAGSRRYPSIQRALGTWLAFTQGSTFAASWSSDIAPRADHPDGLDANPLWQHFEATVDGPGIWKWEHYFEIYHRHLQKFVGGPVDVLEVGIYSGGSLDMWRSYFGPQCHIYGVDIEESCRVYAADDTTVLIGDQEDRSFWAEVRRDVPGVDVIIDDGGHLPDQQIVTLEETLGLLRPGGVYICEDVTGTFHRFTSFASGLADQLNAGIPRSGPADDPTIGGLAELSAFQAAVHSVHFYPYVVVIEKQRTAPRDLRSLKHGSQWQPFLPR